jgi:hypothetical protein
MLLRPVPGDPLVEQIPKRRELSVKIEGPATNGTFPQPYTSPDVSADAYCGGSGGANAIDNACDECCCSCGGSASCALDNLVQVCWYPSLHLLSELLHVPRLRTLLQATYRRISTDVSFS